MFAPPLLTPELASKRPAPQKMTHRKLVIQPESVRMMTSDKSVAVLGVFPPRRAAGILTFHPKEHYPENCAIEEHGATGFLLDHF
jgi:hypothetical protein